MTAPGGLPVVTVKLDDGTGTFPYDITQYVRTPEGITIVRGRADESSQITPSSVTFVVENIDGRFTAGSGTYGITIDRQVQVIYTVGATVSKRFTGGITGLPVAWPDGSDQYAVGSITAVDSLSPWGRRTLKAISTMEILTDNPYSLYRLSEAADSTSAGDLSGNARPALVVAGTGTAPVFGTDGIVTPAFTPVSGGPLPDSLTACTFAGGQYLAGTFVAAGAAAGFFLACAPTPGTPPFTEVLAAWKSQADGSWFALVRDTASNLSVVVSGSAIITASFIPVLNWFHTVEITVSGTTWTLYIDSVASGTGVGPTLTAGTFYTFTVGGADTTPNSFLGSTFVPFNGQLFNVASFTTTQSAARALAHANGTLGGFLTDSSDARVGRVLGYLGVTTTALEAGVQTRVAPQQTEGGNALDTLNGPATSEGGLFFIRGDGVPVLQNRNHRVLKTAADWTITHDDIDPNVQPTLDMQGVFNYVTAKATFTGSEQLAQTAGAATSQYPESLDLLVTHDDEARDRANWIVNVNSVPRPRLPSVTVDLLTQPQAFQQAAIVREISDRLQITGMPSQMLGGTLVDLFIEGWTEVLKYGPGVEPEWSMTFNTSNAADAWAWILGDSTYGVLGTTTRLHY